MLPLTELRGTIEDLLATVSQTENAGHYEMTETRTRLGEIYDELDPGKAPDLAALIPAEFPGISILTTDTSANLKQYIDPRSEQVAALSILVRQGGNAVLSKQEEAIHSEKGGLIREALKNLDDAAVEVNKPDEARSKLREIINGIETGLAKTMEQDAVQGLDSRLAFVPSFPTTKELRLESRRLSIAVWLIWGAVTVVTGVAALVLTSQGFGSAFDYIKCFLWGLSIQAAGQQLQQLTPSSVTTSLKLPVSK